MIDSIWVNESAICCHQNGDKQHTSDDRSSYNCHRPLSNGAVHGLSQTHRLHDTNELGHDLPKVVTKFEVENDNKFYNGRKRQRDIDHDHDVVGQAHQSPDKQSHLPRYERTGYQMRKKDVQIRFDCTQCLTCFSTQSDLLLHERVHHGYFECPQTKVCLVPDSLVNYIFILRTLRQSKIDQQSTHFLMKAIYPTRRLTRYVLYLYLRTSSHLFIYL